MIGPCMCGDICCPGCGPAQGHYRCPVCRKWSSEGCADPRYCASRAGEQARAEYEYGQAHANDWMGDWA